MKNKSDLSADPHQLAAIRHKDGPMMVLAGPGAGKTFVITMRLKYLIWECGIPSEEILVITFTRSAALEMEGRFKSMAGESENVTFGTFHSVFFGILRNFYNLNRSSIISDTEKKRYLKELISGAKLPYADEETLVFILDAISEIKNAGRDIDGLKEGRGMLDAASLKELYRGYTKRLAEERKLDFDDMVSKCLSLFKERPDILDMWRGRYKYIMIDEFQDINPLQYEVVRLLSAPENNLTIVGDDDQAIYAFRGADPKIMLGFKKDYPDAETVRLEMNYRSCGAVVSAGQELVGHNRKRYKKKLKASAERRGTVAAIGCRDRRDEAERIAGIIESARSHGAALRDIAVLFRTNAMTGYFAAGLKAAGIAYYSKDRAEGIFDSREGRDIRAMLDYSKGNRSVENLLCFMNKPLRYIRRMDVDRAGGDIYRMLEAADRSSYMYGHLKRLAYDMERLSSMTPFAAINYIRKGMGYEQACVREAEEFGREASSVTDLLDMLQVAAREAAVYEEWQALIEKEARETEGSGASNDEDAVQLMTMHGSKGLEYRIVIIPELNEGQIPRIKTGRAEETEEERRVLYVAMTRAKERLFMLYREKNLSRKVVPSRFLKELCGGGL